MKGKSYLALSEAEELFRKVKKLYREERQSVKKNGVVAVDQMQARGELLWEIYNADAVMRIDEKLMNTIMKGTTDTDKIVLYFLCLINSMPDIPVELSVKLNFQGEYATVYNAVLNSGEHANPLLLPGLYRAWMGEDMAYDSSLAES